MIEIDDIELWDDWYLYYMYEKIQKEITKRETKTKISKEKEANENES